MRLSPILVSLDKEKKEAVAPGVGRQGRRSGPVRFLSRRKRIEKLGEMFLDLGGDRRRILSAVQGTNERSADFAPVPMRVDQHRQGRRKPILPERPEERPDLLPSFLGGQCKVFLDPFVVLPRLL